MMAVSWARWIVGVGVLGRRCVQVVRLLYLFVIVTAEAAMGRGGLLGRQPAEVWRSIV